MNKKIATQEVPQLKITFQKKLIDKNTAKLIPIDVIHFKDIIISDISQEKAKILKKNKTLPAICFTEFKNDDIKKENAIKSYGIFIDIDNNNENKIDHNDLIRHLNNINVNYILTESVRSKSEHRKMHLFLFFKKPIEYDEFLDTEFFYKNLLNLIFKNSNINNLKAEGNIDLSVKDIFSRRCFVSHKESFYFSNFKGTFIDAEQLISIKKNEENKVINLEQRKADTKQEYFRTNIKKGNRNNHLASSVGALLARMKRFDKESYNMALFLARAWNASLSNPINEKEVENTVSSIFNNVASKETILGCDNLTDLVSKIDSNLITLYKDYTTRDFVIIRKDTKYGGVVAQYIQKSDLKDTIKNLLYEHNIPYNSKVLKVFFEEQRYKTLKTVFAPEKKYNYDENEYNLFKPTKYFLLQGEKINFNEKCPIIREIIVNLMSDPGLTMHFLNWLAYFFQTREKSQVAFLFSGIQGSGKNLLFEIIKSLFGEKYTHLANNRSIATKFNSELENKLFVFFNEVKNKVFSNESTMEDVVKEIITEPTMNVEKKGKEKYKAKNAFNCIFASNHSVPIKLEIGDRRFNVSFARNKIEPILEAKGLINRGDNILEKIKEKEIEYFAKYLLAYKTDKALYNKVYDTEAKKILTANSNTNVINFFYAIINKDYEYLIELEPNIARNYYSSGNLLEQLKYYREEIFFLPNVFLKEFYLACLKPEDVRTTKITKVLKSPPFLLTNTSKSIKLYDEDKATTQRGFIVN